MTAYLYRMPAGIAGAVSRINDSKIKQEVFTGNPAASYGLPVAIQTDGTVAPAGASDTVYGFLVRPYPSQPTAVDSDGTVISANKLVDIMVSGYMTVSIPTADVATATKGTAVKNSGTGVGAASGTAIPLCFFEGSADASGNVEIRFNV